MATLRENEERLRLAFKATRDVIWIYDPVSDRKYWSEHGIKVFGWTADEQHARPGAWWLDRVHEEDRSWVEQLLQNGLADPRCSQLEAEYRFERADGGFAHVLDRCFIVRDEAGHPVRLIGAMQDATARKELETERLRLQRQLDQAQQITRLGSWEYHHGEDRLIWSDETYRIFGIQREAFSESYGGFLAHVHPEDRPAVEAAYARSLTDPEYQYEIQHRMIKVDTGEVRWVYEKCLHERDARDGTVVRSLGVVQDITEERVREAQRNRLAAAAEQAGEIIVITDLDGVIQYVNPAFEKITGYHRDEAIGQNPRILNSGHHDKAYFRDLWETITAGGVWHGRLVNRRKDGTVYTESATISPVFDSTGRIVNFVAAKMDITEQLLRDEQLHQSQKMEAIGRLAGGVAHDFNNMLQVILGGTELALAPDADPRKAHEHLHDIRAAATRASEVASQLLAFARKQVVAPRIISLNDVVEGLLKMLRRLIGEDVKLVWRPENRIHAIHMDPGQVNQILANLCINARDAIADHGMITVSTFEQVFDGRGVRQLAEATPAGLHVCLEVSDDGPGMDEDTRLHAFDPFFTTKTEGKGTGLGLPMVYGIAKQNGGFAEIDSRPGKGTAVRVYIPATTAQPAHEMNEDKTALRRALQGGTETVLVVEDEPVVLKSAVRFLERAGYTVLRAEGAACAERQVRSHEGRIDLLLTDVIMPEASGKELANRLQQDHPHLKVIYMSGYAEDKVSRLGVVEEGIHFLQKPFSGSELTGKVRAVLDLGP